MYTIEFQTKIENGTIRIPEEHSVRLREQGISEAVRVILYVPGQEYDVDYVERLMSQPIRLDDFVPLRRSEIYDRA
ncbi:MAG: hypothetical protein PHY79_14080 [Anaerolineae bacterium]|jgi:hypothetical protein|nr:hypothetical protein [Anaerolineae bacterium]MDX9833222.1 hypothetical protein [Anaerolineae bacterium]